MVAGHAGETDSAMSESESGAQSGSASMSMVNIKRSDSSICMQQTRTCGMFVNIAPRDLLIQQRRPGHPGNVVHTAGLPVHSCVVLKMAYQSHGNQSPSEKFPIAVLLFDVIVYFFIVVYRTCLEKYRILKKWFSSS